MTFPTLYLSHGAPPPVSYTHLDVYKRQDRARDLGLPTGVGPLRSACNGIRAGDELLDGAVVEVHRDPAPLLLGGIDGALEELSLIHI